MMLATLDLTQLLASAGLAGVLVWLLISFQLSEYRRIATRLTLLEDERAQTIASQIHAQERSARALSDLTHALFEQSRKIGALVETMRYRPCLYDGLPPGRIAGGNDSHKPPPTSGEHSHFQHQEKKHDRA